ncbi:MAG: hypothetical protein ACWA6R_00590 [Nitrosomonas sp.]
MIPIYNRVSAVADEQDVRGKDGSIYEKACYKKPIGQPGLYQAEMLVFL